MLKKQACGPIVWPLIIAIIGVLLLLDRFLLLESLDITSLWPILLVLVGAGVLLRGDILPDDRPRKFSITRGSVESALLEISAGELDVTLYELERKERLIAGQYTAASRPALTTQDTHAHLRLNRAATRWLNFADWNLGLATDLPWQLFVSTSLGQVNLDLSKLIVEKGVIATGVGDIRLICPLETLGPLRLKSALGNIQFITPMSYKTRVHIDGPGTLTLHVDNRRYTEAEKGTYIARDAAPDAPVIDIYIVGAFGDVFLA